MLHASLLPYIAAFSVFGLTQNISSAAITITLHKLTTNSVTVEIFGTMPATVPPNGSNTISIVGEFPSLNPGFALGNLMAADSFSFSGSQSLATMPVATGNENYGDYFYIEFADSLMPGEEISGILNASWNTVAFDPTGNSPTKIGWAFWGFDPLVPYVSGSFNTPITGGTLLTSLTIPEPSITLIMSIFPLILLRRSRVVTTRNSVFARYANR